LEPALEGFDGQDGKIVVQVPVAFPVDNFLFQRADTRVERTGLTVNDLGLQPLFAELLALHVRLLDDSVGVHEQPLPRVQSDLAMFVLVIFDHPSHVDYGQLAGIW
jgi:hypothetical protein